MKFFAIFILLACVEGLAWGAGRDTKVRQGRDAFNETTIGGKSFFYETTMKLESNTDAMDSCGNEFACLADLKNFTPQMFASLARFLPEGKTFWIGGLAGAHSLTDYFTTCNGASASVEFGTIDPTKIILSSSSCLAFNRPIDSLQSQILALPCSTEAVALCTS